MCRLARAHVVDGGGGVCVEMKFIFMTTIFMCCEYTQYFITLCTKLCSVRARLPRSRADTVSQSVSNGYYQMSLRQLVYCQVIHLIRSLLQLYEHSDCCVSCVPVIFRHSQTLNRIEDVKMSKITTTITKRQTATKKNRKIH